MLSIHESSTKVFFALIRAGLWTELEKQVSLDGSVDWEEVYRLASEQSVLGLVLAGVDCLPIDQRPPKVLLLQWIGEIQMLERQNKEMNVSVAWIIERLRKENISAVLVKGQGIAQCYSRPLWRSPGDIDLLLAESNYNKAKIVLQQFLTQTGKENLYRKHIAFSMSDTIIELHGSLRVGFSKNWDDELDSIQNRVLQLNETRIWKNGETDILLPSPENDVAFVFAHIIQHLFKGGIGLRQFCDWCMLLWKYQAQINQDAVVKHIHNLGLWKEWCVVSGLAVNYLGLAPEVIPGLKESIKNRRKAKRLMRFVVKTGNFGHSRDLTYYQRYPYLVVKTISLKRRIADFFTLLMIFPQDSLRFFSYTFTDGIKAVINGN